MIWSAGSWECDPPQNSERVNPVQRKMYKEDDIDIWDDNLKMEDSDGQVGQGLYFYCHVNKKYVLQTLIFRPSLVKVRGRVKLRKFDSNSNSCSNSLLFALFQVKSGTCSLFVELPTDIRSYRIDIFKVFSLTYQVTIQSHMLPTTVSLLWAFRAINVNVFKPC